VNALEGQLELTLVVADGRVTQVDVKSTRPPPISPLLERRSVEEAAQLAFSLFSVCRVAQGACARSALGLAHTSPTALALEVLEHHAWQFEVEWPRALGAEPRAAELKATLQVLRSGSRTQIVKHLREAPLSSVVAQFLRRCRELDEGVDWPTPRVGHPTLAECEAGLAGAVDFAARPGTTEVGPLARVFADQRVQQWGATQGWGP
jgi:hypothetical protein